MITEKIILSLLGRVLLSIEMVVSQFIWNIDINQGIFSRSDYLVWTMFNGNINKIWVYQKDYLPFIAMLTGVIAGFQILLNKKTRLEDAVQNISIAIILMISGTYIIRYTLKFLYYAILSSSPYLSNLSYYFSDSFVINQLTNNLGANNSYVLVFFSSIYTVSGIELGIFLMLRIGILIGSYFFLPVLSFAIVTKRGKEVVLKIWLLFIETATMPLLFIPFLYIYMNLLNNSFAQLGILIFIVTLPGLFSFGLYKTASFDYSSIPYVVQVFSPQSTMGYFNESPKLISKVYQEKEMSKMNAFPETNIERLLRGND